MSGVVFFLPALLLACHATGSHNSLAVKNELVVGIPEANLPGAELGVGQFAKLLSFESLTQNAAEGRALPRLAERWHWEDNDRTLRVFLRSEVYLHDGRQFAGETAAQIVRDAVSDRDNLARYPALGDIDAIKAETDRELVFTLSQPSSMLPEDLTVPLDVGKEPVGTGAYRVVQRNDDELVLERFDRYYLGRPSIERVVVRTFDQLRTTWASLLRGEVDMVYDVTADAVEFVSNDDVRVVTVPRWYQFMVVFNSGKAPFQSPAIRRALNVAVDRASLIDRVLQGRGSPATGPLWPKYWAYDDSVGSYSYDPVEAAALLEEAGLRVSASGSDHTRPPSRLRFTCLIPENYSVWERIALEVQKDLFDVGVDMQFEVLPIEEYLSRFSTGDFEAAFIDLISGPTPERSYIFWRSARESKGPYNVFGYENPESERLFDTLRRSTNESVVRSGTRRLQRAMLEDPPAIFLAWNERNRAIRRDFIIPEKVDSDLMWTLWQWSRDPREVPSRQ